MNIEINIEELRLHGFGYADRYLIRDAIMQELTRLMSTQGTPALLQHAGDHLHLHGGEFQVTPHAPAENLGAQIGQAVFGGMKQ